MYSSERSMNNLKKLNSFYFIQKIYHDNYGNIYGYVKSPNGEKVMTD